MKQIRLGVFPRRIIFALTNNYLYEFFTFYFFLDAIASLIALNSDSGLPVDFSVRS